MCFAAASVSGMNRARLIAAVASVLLATGIAACGSDDNDTQSAGLDEGTATNVKKWLDYALGDGQQVAPQLEYAPLPGSIRTKAQRKVDGLQCNGSPLS